MSGQQRGLGRGEAAELLVDLSEAINSNLDLTDVLQAVTDVGTEISGAAFGAFFYNAVDDAGRSYRLHVLSGADTQQFVGLPSPRITPLFEPTFSGTGIVRIDDLHHEPRAGALPTGHLPVRSYLATPVVAADGEIIGGLLFGHPEPGVFEERTETLARTVASHAAVAVRNARLFAAEKEARRRAEEMAASLALLQDVTAKLATARRTEDVLDTLVEAIVEPLGAERLGVYAPGEDGRLRSLPTADLGPRVRTAYYEVVPDFPSLGRRAFEEARPLWLTNRNELEKGYPELSADLAEVHALIALPLMVAGICHGSMVLTWTSERDFGNEEIGLLEAVAGQLAATMERVRAAEAETIAQAELHQYVAELTESSRTLQRSLLPQALPQVEGLEYAVRYLPGTAGAEVGGDWYDVVVSPQGVVTLVVGDVEGHSFSAAAVMGTVSTALRAYLLEGHAPEVALARVNPIVEQTGVIATCCLVSLDPSTGEVSVVRAGHPYPIYRVADGTTREAGVEGGPPLGVAPTAVWPVTKGWAAAGDRLVLYTDGLVERSQKADEVELSQLVGVVAGASGSPEHVADLVLDSLPGRAEDDVALLVADFTGRILETCARIRVESQQEVAVARRFSRETLRDWELVGLTESVTLLVSEMVTNALLHADGTAVLELRPERGGVRVSVTDTTALTPQPRDADGDDVNGRGLLLVEALAQDWGVEPAASGKTVWARVVDAEPMAEQVAR
ncbi:MAG: SpoIIE family protein phosphatase [Actinomycetota bacterium]